MYTYWSNSPHIHTYIHTYIHTGAENALQRPQCPKLTLVGRIPHIHTHTYILTYIHTYIHTHIRTYRCRKCLAETTMPQAYTGWSNFANKRACG